MNPTEPTIRLKLIEGEFSNEDAREVILGLLNYKLNFHDLKNFSQMERQGTAHAPSLKRVPELKADKSLFVSWLGGVCPEKKIRIQADIQLYLEDD